MNLPIQTITADFCVSPQLEPAAMVAAAAAGFRSVINNRPDFEGGASQPTSVEVEAAALAAGLSYRHLPVAGGFQSPDEIAQFKQLLNSLPKPILAFCRSGARSAKLFAAANQL